MIQWRLLVDMRQWTLQVDMIQWRLLVDMIQSVPMEKLGQKVKKMQLNIAKIRRQSCKIRGNFMYSNLHKNMHKNTCFMPISIIFAKMK